MQQVFTTTEFGRFRENSWKREFSEVLVEFVHMMPEKYIHLRSSNWVCVVSFVLMEIVL